MSPQREAHRLQVVQSLGLLDTPREDRFDRISRVAADVFDVPVAFVALLDAERQWTKSCVGLADVDLPRKDSVCATTIQGDGPLVVPDLSADDRFRDLPVVTGPPHMRAYAGHPLVVEGAAVGTLCLVDLRPRTFSQEKLARLADLARWAEDELAAVELTAALQQERSTRTRLSAVLDAAPDAILVIDAEGLVVEGNAAVTDVFGRTRDAVLGLPVDALLGRDDGGPLLPLGSGRAQALRPTGRVPVEVRFRPLELQGVAGVLDVRDLSRDEAAQREIALLQRRHDLIFAAAETGIIGTDEHGRISVANDAARRMLAATEPLVGLDLHECLHEPGGKPLHPRERCPLLRALDERVTVRVAQEPHLRFDGEPIDVEYAAAPVLLEQVVTGAVVTINDISARRAIERMKDEFVSVVSHELRTPLTSIRGSLGLLGSGRLGELDERAARLVQIAAGNTDRLVRLVNDILDLERIESGKVDVDLRLQPLRPLLLSAREAVVGAGSAEVAVEVGTQDAEAAVDADLLVQAVTNLTANAVKFSPPGGRVELTVNRSGPEVVVSVTDQGRGIPADRLERVFERFEQVDASDAREKGGTGLGLAITRSIAARLGGQVRVTSELGVGSTFSLVLPAPVGSTEEEAARVVVVEDDVDLLEVLEQALRVQGVPFATARTEDDAVALVSRLRPALLVLDVELAQGSGYGVAARLRADPALAGTPVVVATVHDLDEAQLNRLRLGPMQLVRKGRGNVDLVQVVVDAAVAAAP